MAKRDTHKARQHGSRLRGSLDTEQTTVRFGPLDTIFAQGDRCADVMYIERGRVTLSVVSPGGRTSVVAALKVGAFFGEGALAGQRRRTSTARSVKGSTIVIVKTATMRRQLLEDSALADRFRSHMLARGVRLQQDLVDQLFNGCEKRLARALLLFTPVEEQQLPRYPLPNISRNLLADLIGTTRSRVDYFMNKFRKLGFLERSRTRHGGLLVHRSMLSVVLQD
jgi:CRP-like cAMP-binding protein